MPVTTYRTNQFRQSLSIHRHFLHYLLIPNGEHYLTLDWLYSQTQSTLTAIGYYHNDRRPDRPCPPHKRRRMWVRLDKLDLLLDA